MNEDTKTVTPEVVGKLEDQSQAPQSNVVAMPLDRTLGLSRERVNEMHDQLLLLQEFISKVMVRGEHYGIIPGTSKPSLYKAGAEFLREAYGFEVKAECVEKVHQVGAQAPGPKDYFAFTYRVDVLKAGVTVGSCEGSCNSYERKYRNLDPYGIVNTLQKMAQKRAYVGAVISATRSGNVFTQDVEDDPEALGINPNGREPQAPNRGKGNTNVTPNVPPVTSGAPRMATTGQSKLVWARLKNELFLNDFAAKAFIKNTVGKEHSKDLTSADIQKLLDAIEAGVKEIKALKKPADTAPKKEGFEDFEA